MSTAVKNIRTAVIASLFVLSVSLMALTPISAQAYEVSPAADGHGAASVENTYKDWVADGNLYRVLHYDVTYKVINYTTGYTCLGTRTLGTNRFVPSPTAGIGAFGTVTQYQYMYSVY